MTKVELMGMKWDIFISDIIFHWSQDTKIFQ